jgi:signal peptidase I
MNFTGTGITDTLYTLCYGDLNNSFVPGSGKNSEPGVSIISDPTFNGSACGNSVCYYPLRINEFFDLSALSLVIMWPEEVRVEDVLIPGSSMQPIFSQEGGLLRLSWYSLEPLMLAAGDTVLLFKINTGILKGMPVPVAISESEAINSGGQLERLQLAAPIIEDRKESYLEVFPVPSDGGVTLRYSCTTVESSTVIILNAQGQRIKEFVLEGKDAISGEIQVGSDELPSGAYVVTFLNNQVKLVKRIIIL